MAWRMAFSNGQVTGGKLGGYFITSLAGWFLSAAAELPTVAASSQDPKAGRLQAGVASRHRQGPTGPSPGPDSRGRQESGE
uniref:Uncharacterized protein n=1 Tax=Oryza punctata TaxID=4537 RepID=A0A0E0K5R2_ORYPU